MKTYDHITEIAINLKLFKVYLQKKYMQNRQSCNFYKNRRQHKRSDREKKNKFLLSNTYIFEGFILSKRSIRAFAPL